MSMLEHDIYMMNNVTANVHDAPPSVEALSLARLRQKAICHSLQQCQLTIYVPPNAIGAIIGRGGRSILSIQQEAKRRSLGHDIGVRIHVAGNSGGGGHDGGSASTFTAGVATWNYSEYQLQLQQQQQLNSTSNDADWVPVTIRGDPIGCLEACRLIIPLVDRPQDPTYLTIVMDVPIARAKHNQLVGKGGIILAALSATYETRIMIPPNELMSNVEASGNIWKQRQQLQQQQLNTGNDAGLTMLFDMGSGGGAGSNTMSQANATTVTGGLSSNIIQLEGEIDNVEQCLVRMLGIVAAEEKFIPTGIVVDCDTADALSTTPTKKVRGTDNNKGSPIEKIVARTIIVANASIPSKIWRSLERKTNTKIQRKNIREENVAGDDVDPSLFNDIEDFDGDDDNDDVVNKDDTDEADARAQFIITGKEQAVQKATAQIEKMIGLEVGSTEIVRVVSVEVSPTNRGDDQPNGEGAASGKKNRKKRGKKKATSQPD